MSGGFSKGTFCARLYNEIIASSWALVLQINQHLSRSEYIYNGDCKGKYDLEMQELLGAVIIILIILSSRIVAF